MAATETPLERLALALLIDTGIRRSELLSIRGSDIDWEQRIILIKGKGGKPRWIAPGVRTWALLAAQRNGAGPMFQFKRTSLHRMLKRIADRAGVTGVYPHRFRVNWECRLLEAGAGEIVAGHLAGHSLEMVRYYQRAVEQRRALEQGRRFSLGDRL